MTDDRLHAPLKVGDQGRSAFAGVQIADVAEMAQVERDIILALGDEDNFPTERMGDR